MYDIFLYAFGLLTGIVIGIAITSKESSVVANTRRKSGTFKTNELTKEARKSFGIDEK